MYKWNHLFSALVLYKQYIIYYLTVFRNFSNVFYLLCNRAKPAFCQSQQTNQVLLLNDFVQFSQSKIIRNCIEHMLHLPHSYFCVFQMLLFDPKLTGKDCSKTAIILLPCAGVGGRHQGQRPKPESNELESNLGYPSTQCFHGSYNTRLSLMDTVLPWTINFCSVKISFKYVKTPTLLKERN